MTPHNAFKRSSETIEALHLTSVNIGSGLTFGKLTHNQLLHVLDVQGCSFRLHTNCASIPSRQFHTKLVNGDALKRVADMGLIGFIENRSLCHSDETWSMSGLQLKQDNL